ncbi:MAG: hypothetical protein JOY86_04530 [Candidatus Eremiobacteraeota bacterium]|nr:hypothetical protein [Candidatus Eremiobacteraeota bacterium]
MDMPGRLIRFTAVALLLCAIAPCCAWAQDSPAFVAGIALPQVVYYGDCGLEQPMVLTLRSDFVSDLSMRVTARYDYVADDPKLPESTTLAVQMTQISMLRYSGSINVGTEAFAYLRGGDGLLRYHVTAIDALQNATQGDAGFIAVRHCGPQLSEAR